MSLIEFLEMHFSNAEREASQHRFEDVELKKEFIVKYLTELRKDFMLKSLLSFGFTIEKATNEVKNSSEEQIISDYFDAIKLDLETKQGWYKDRPNGLWLGYKKYLRDEKGITTSNINEIDKSTTRIIDKLNNPKITQLQKVEDRGLVIGKIQSGKTTHMFGLISKLIDRKFDVIVILTGIHEDLRSQTQSRLEADLLGHSTDLKKNIGIGEMDPFLANRFKIKTTMELDLRKNNLFHMDFALETKSSVYAVKKNKSVLESLNIIIEDANKNNKSIVIIDDESDFASINTKKDGVTLTNSEIRKALNKFNLSYYIAYTATPYANFFINKNERDEQIGPELFPKTFIEVLYPPKEYTGFESFIEHKVYNNDLINFVDDKKSLNEEHIFNIVLDYIISVALREEFKKNRNLSPFATLLINDDIRVATHEITQQIIEEYFAILETQFRFEQNKVTTKIQKILNIKFNNIYKIKKEVLSNYDANSVINTILKINFFNKCKIFPLNSRGPKIKTTDIYNDINEFIIIIGGHKLSRGLTIEGLLVTSITRKVDNMADVLSQAARWCGYRSEYIDLMSIYTTWENVQSYLDVITINDELVRQIEYINGSETSPLDYRFGFIKPPKMRITNAKKMRSSITKIEHFANELVQTLKVDVTKINANLSLVESFINSIAGSKVDSDKCLYFSNISSSQVLKFIDNYAIVNDNPNLYTYKTYPAYWSQYIKDANKYNELIDWSIAIRSNKRGDEKHSYKLGDFEIKLPNLKVTHDPINGIMSYKSTTYPKDEFLDHIIEHGYEYDINDERSKARELRPKEKGLLMIYLTYHEGTNPIVTIAISFPKETSVSNESPSGKVYTT